MPSFQNQVIQSLKREIRCAILSVNILPGTTLNYVQYFQELNVQDELDWHWFIKHTHPRNPIARLMIDFWAFDVPGNHRSQDSLPRRMITEIAKVSKKYASFLNACRSYGHVMHNTKQIDARRQVLEKKSPVYRVGTDWPQLIRKHYSVESLSRTCRWKDNPGVDQARRHNARDRGL